MAAFIMCAERSTACTFASAPSFLPLATALRTAETKTTSFIKYSSSKIQTICRTNRELRGEWLLGCARRDQCARMLVPQRLPGLQGVLHPFLRLFCTQQPHERL